jgi:hypothetical protein
MIMMIVMVMTYLGVPCSDQPQMVPSSPPLHMQRPVVTYVLYDGELG